MKWGVPLMALVALFMPSVVLAIWLGVLVSWWLCAVVFVACAMGFVWMRKVTIHDLHANILYALGVEHTQLTHLFGGRNMRLTDVHGTILPAWFA